MTPRTFSRWAGDINGLFCDPAPSCVTDGDFAVQGGTIVFDPGTPEEDSVNFTMLGDTLTANGTVDGSAISATFLRRS